MTSSGRLFQTLAPATGKARLLTVTNACGLTAQNEYSSRRMSDPSSSWNYFQHGSLKRTGVRKSRSGLENVETIDNPGCNEVEAGNFEDGKRFCCCFFCSILLFG